MEPPRQKLSSAPLDKVASTHLIAVVPAASHRTLSASRAICREVLVRPSPLSRRCVDGDIDACARALEPARTRVSTFFAVRASSTSTHRLVSRRPGLSSWSRDPPAKKLFGESIQPRKTRLHREDFLVRTVQAVVDKA